MLTRILFSRALAFSSTNFYPKKRLQNPILTLTAQQNDVWLQINASKSVEQFSKIYTNNASKFSEPIRVKSIMTLIDLIQQNPESRTKINPDVQQLIGKYLKSLQAQTMDYKEMIEFLKIRRYFSSSLSSTFYLPQETFNNINQKIIDITLQKYPTVDEQIDKLIILYHEVCKNQLHVVAAKVCAKLYPFFFYKSNQKRKISPSQALFILAANVQLEQPRGKENFLSSMALKNINQDFSTLKHTHLIKIVDCLCRMDITQLEYSMGHYQFQFFAKLRQVIDSFSEPQLINFTKIKCSHQNINMRFIYLKILSNLFQKINNDGTSELETRFLLIIMANVFLKAPIEKLQPEQINKLEKFLEKSMLFDTNHKTPLFKNTMLSLLRNTRLQKQPFNVSIYNLIIKAYENTGMPFQLCYELSLKNISFSDNAIKFSPSQVDSTNIEAILMNAVTLKIQIKQGDKMGLDQYMPKYQNLIRQHLNDKKKFIYLNDRLLKLTNEQNILIFHFYYHFGEQFMKLAQPDPAKNEQHPNYFIFYSLAGIILKNLYKDSERVKDIHQYLNFQVSLGMHTQIYRYQNANLLKNRFQTLVDIDNSEFPLRQAIQEKNKNYLVEFMLYLQKLNLFVFSRLYQIRFQSKFWRIMGIILKHYVEICQIVGFFRTNLLIQAYLMRRMYSYEVSAQYIHFLTKLKNIFFATHQNEHRNLICALRNEILQECQHFSLLEVEQCKTLQPFQKYPSILKKYLQSFTNNLNFDNYVKEKDILNVFVNYYNTNLVPKREEEIIQTIKHIKTSYTQHCLVNFNLGKNQSTQRILHDLLNHFFKDRVLYPHINIIQILNKLAAFGFKLTDEYVWVKNVFTLLIDKWNNFTFLSHTKMLQLLSAFNITYNTEYQKRMESYLQFKKLPHIEHAINALISTDYPISIEFIKSHLKSKTYQCDIRLFLGFQEQLGQVYCKQFIQQLQNADKSRINITQNDLKYLQHKYPNQLQNIKIGAQDFIKNVYFAYYPRIQLIRLLNAICDVVGCRLEIHEINQQRFNNIYKIKDTYIYFTKYNRISKIDKKVNLKHIANSLNISQDQIKHITTIPLTQFSREALNLIARENTYLNINLEDQRLKFLKQMNESIHREKEAGIADRSKAENQEDGPKINIRKDRKIYQPKERVQKNHESNKVEKDQKIKTSESIDKPQQTPKKDTQTKKLFQSHKKEQKHHQKQQKQGKKQLVFQTRTQPKTDKSTQKVETAANTNKKPSSNKNPTANKQPSKDKKPTNPPKISSDSLFD